MMISAAFNLNFKYENNYHWLSPLQHSILKPFMLRRVKTDVISELTRKTEVTVHCKLSSRQQAFYQAIKNKISLAELFDGNRGHLNEKKILNLMNIVIQLRKVCCLFCWSSILFPTIFEKKLCSEYGSLWIFCRQYETFLFCLLPIITYFAFANFRFVIILSCLRGMREAHTSILGISLILYCLLLLGSWRTYTMQEVTIL